MFSRRARVPFTLLLTKELPVTAKLVYIALLLDNEKTGVPHSPYRLAHLLGMSRPTVRNALQLIANIGSTHQAVLDPSATSDSNLHNRCATLPGGLIVDSRVSPQAKIMYGLLQATPMYERGQGRFTYASLGEMGPQSARTSRKAVKELTQAGWLQTRQVSQVAPIVFTLTNPIDKHLRLQMVEMQRRLRNGQFLGETLMRETLTLVVDSPEYVDNHSPSFLKNPLTGERMHLDRYYTEGVAFEFNGPQHYGPTEFYTQEEFAKQQARDILKAEYCRINNIRLIIVRADDLGVEYLIRKTVGFLPLRDLRLYETQVKYLNRLCSRYRHKASRGLAD